tara:strand:- start:2090 stop:2248 length:159 start_codon:yes stop_codon:yes gene_type:complete
MSNIFERDLHLSLDWTVYQNWRELKVGEKAINWKESTSEIRNVKRGLSYLMK